MLLINQNDIWTDESEQWDFWDWKLNLKVRFFEELDFNDWDF